MTNNFEQIEKLLEFTEKDTFFFIQIIKRRKENPEMTNGTYIVDNFYVYDKSDLSRQKERIIVQCEKHNARAYINLNKLNAETIALHTLKKITDLIIQKQFKSVKNAYAATCGSHTSEKNKRWIVDIDAEELPYKNEIIEIINDLHSQIKKSNYKIIAEIPTRNGVHIISNPFNLKDFNDRIEKMNIKIDVHKNSPTLLYLG
jgi:hypothetical protein